MRYKMNIYVNSRQLAVILGIKRSTINYYLYYRKIPKYCKKIDLANCWEIGVVNQYLKTLPVHYNLDVNAIRDMNNKGFSRAKMALELGVPDHAVRYILDKYCIKSKSSTVRKEHDRPSKAAKLFNTFLKAQLKGKS